MGDLWCGGLSRESCGINENKQNNVNKQSEHGANKRMDDRGRAAPAPRAGVCPHTRTAWRKQSTAVKREMGRAEHSLGRLVSVGLDESGINDIFRAFGRWVARHVAWNV